jgi:hypothetical protein
MKRLPRLAAALAASLPLAASSGRAAEPPLAARNDIVYSTEVETPHVDWATRLPGGPIRGFFVPSIRRGRDMVELMQRLSLEPTTVSIDRDWDVNCWGLGDFYGHEERGDRDDFRVVYGYVEQELAGSKPFEVIVLPGLNGWTRLTRASRDAILRRVRDGAGLVLLHPFVGDVAGHPFLGDEPAGDERLWELSPLVGVPDDTVTERGYPAPREDAIREGRWRVAQSHPITDGLDLELVPAGARGARFYAYRPNGDVLIEAGGLPVVASRSYGKGRVVAFAQVGDGFVPDPIDPVAEGIPWSYWEYQHALLARAVLWAAGRPMPVRLTHATASDAGVTLAFSSDRARELEVEVAARSEFGDELGRRRVRRSVPAGESALTVTAAELRPASGWPGGRILADAIVRDASDGSTLTWAASHFLVPKPATLTRLRAGSTLYREGDTVSVVTQSSGSLEGARVRMSYSDDLGRLLHVEEAATRGERPFFYRADGFLGKRLFVAARLLDAGGRLLDERRLEPLTIVARERRKPEYRALLSFETPAHFETALRQRRLRAQAMDTGFTWAGEITDSLDVPRGYFGVYWYDRGPTTPEAMEKAIRDFERTGDLSSLQYLTRKELYRRTGDRRFLTRSPSLDDPDVLELLRSVSETAARNKAPYNMDYYFVGDEGSLTSYTDPVDYCWGEHTLRNFRAWLQQRYGSLDALNAKWQSRFARWEDVLPSTTEEARKTRVFPPWSDHRTYMEVSFARAYAAVREAVVKGDPQGRIALSGTQVSTPYNGCDWYRLDQVVDDFLSYGGGNQWDFHRAFAKPGARVGFWTGYGRSGAAVQHEIWKAALSGVLFPNLFWSYSVVNPDLTFSRSGRDMGRVFQALRFEGVGRLLMEAERRGDGIGLHYSMPSIHAAGILGLHPNHEDDGENGPGFPKNRDGWTKALADLGYSYDFVAYAKLEQGLDPKRTRVFVLPMSLALSEAERKALDAYVRAGGILVADAAAGLVDDHAAWRPGALDALFGIATGAPAERHFDASKSGAVERTAAGRAFGLPAEGLDGLEALEKDVRGTRAAALLTVGGAPAVFVRREGAGHAVYLNLTFERYAGERAKAYGGAAQRRLLAALLERLGVRPAVRVEDAQGRPLAQAQVARYRFGAADVVAVLQEVGEAATRYGRDGVALQDDSASAEAVRQAVVVRLPRAGFVTNVRTGEDLGRTDVVRTSLAAGDALVLAVQDERPELRLAGPGRETLGRPVAFRLASAGAERLVRCHVFDAAGAFVPEYASNVLLDGSEGACAWPSALDDPPGRYRVEATDLTSGRRATATVELSQPEVKR